MSTVDTRRWAMSDVDVVTSCRQSVPHTSDGTSWTKISAGLWQLRIGTIH